MKRPVRGTVRFVSSGFVLILMSGTAFAAWITILDPTGTVPPGSQQPYGEHQSVWKADVVIWNTVGNQSNRIDRECEVDVDEWYVTEDTTLDLGSYYMEVEGTVTGGGTVSDTEQGLVSSP